MSFTSFNDSPLRSREQVARDVHKVSLARGLDELATVMALMTIGVEVGANDQYWCPANEADPESFNFPHDSTSNDGRSVGYFQQQKGPKGEPWWGTSADEMTLATAANNFLDRLAGNYRDAAQNPSLAGQFCQRVQGSAYPARYAGKWGEAWEVLRAALKDDDTSPVQPPQPAPNVPPVPVQPQESLSRPGYNEYPRWCANLSARGRKPDLFLLHTQEGDGTADQLASYLISTEGGNSVSYHYTVSQDYHDGGVTVCDVVDTDFASWSVMNSNSRSINLCFAGSRASWSRDEWMRQGNAIDVAAYIAVKDCKKYGIPPKVLWPYSPAPGIADHKYCTQFLRDGNNHTDIGDNFPWDYFAQRVQYWATGDNTPITPPAEDGPVADRVNDPFLKFVKTATDRQLLEYIAVQVGPGDPVWPSHGTTLRDRVWSLKCLNH